MTYLKNGIEYLDDDEQRVFSAIKRLNAQGRTTNNSQIASYVYPYLSRTKVAKLTQELSARRFIKDVSKGRGIPLAHRQQGIRL